MAVNSTFTPKASLTEAPTNLKEAIDWVLRVTGRDGKENKDECICGLAAAVTDLLQSVELEYHGYQGDVKNGAEGDSKTTKGASADTVKGHLNGLFSLVQGLGGTAVVRTYIDQLAQYLKDLTPNDMSCGKCGCLKVGAENHHLGRGCDKCDGDKCGKPGAGGGCQCQCKGGASGCTSASDCKCDRKCGCTIDTYRSAYRGRYSSESYVGETITAYRECMWNSPTNTTSRHQCARILLGSVCLIWSGLTYMYWTGKWHGTSPRWNNHILDGSGLDDGTLSQWLQALGFPKDMLNNSGPQNRLDKVIWDGLRDKFLLGFLEPSGLDSGSVSDTNGNTARSPYGMNYPGFIHTAHRDSFNTDAATVFTNGSSTTNRISDTDQNKNGALFKLYILSCAYFTGLQKKNSESTTGTTANNPKTIREILYWLSALPYSPAYKEMLDYAKRRLEKVLKKPGDAGSSASNQETQLKFHQTGRWHPITVHEYNLFAHFQAVTQYCPLVLIGIQGGLHSTKGTDKTTEPPIHSLYANTECNFTYPTVSIQAYNQVVHYIRALFYQLYFLRKQCAVKVALGGKWRECRYGDGVVSKGVNSWMCLGCSPMEHYRKWRVEKVKGETLKMMKESDPIVKNLKALLEAIGQVVVQLGNAQEALEGKDKEAIKKVKEKLTEAKGALGKAKEGLDQVKDGLNGQAELKEAKGKLGELTNGGKGALHILVDSGNTPGSLQQIVDSGQEWRKDYSSAKDRISEAIDGLHKVLEILKEGVEKQIKEEAKEAKKTLDVFFKLTNDENKLENVLKQELSYDYTALLNAINQLISICNSPKCPPCNDHINKCGQKPVSRYCDKCHQQYMDGTPSPLQAFLEDRLPGFSCDVVRNTDTDKDTVYPPAASHLGHCNGSGQCCPLPMGFRGQFYSGSTSDMTGSRLYGILYFFSNENMMQSCVYTLVRVTAALSATTPQVLGDVFGFFRGGVGNKESGKNKQGTGGIACKHEGDPSTDTDKSKYYCGWCASGLRDVVKKIEWIPNGNGTDGGSYRGTLGKALIGIKGDKSDSSPAPKSTTTTTPSALSTLTKDSEYLSPLTGELYTTVSDTFGGTYLSWVLYLSDALEGGLKSLASEFQQIECRGCKGQCDPNKCRKGSHGSTAEGSKGTALCTCQSIVSCTGVLPVLYRHGFSYGNPFNLEGFQQGDGKTDGQYDITKAGSTKKCHEFLESLNKVLEDKQAASNAHPLSNLLTQVGKLQYDIRLPWIFVLTIAWLVAVLYLAFGAIWPLDWAHMRSHCRGWFRKGSLSPWEILMVGKKKGRGILEFFGKT
ncbi:variant erythrocyte surface antigen-1 alpha subunit [Babesia bovis T2Bo]|uniref:variant erythrocyte surface antigen-1 alpha subunit n=1 Tax=Babesia bovis T2Bo TaxID=484906 RepID=UPI001C354F30|nr:variant erythrocyte surface antigen-1 alpha subunit [Babesia bovis T2Bo]EDO05472.2 variant erythrocyte surface antigen-1 alpha subunit [Babesia bovis T2Bo]